MTINDFKEEYCNNCHHRKLSCEETIEDCYKTFKGGQNDNE